MKVRVPCPAKVNTFLTVGRRDAKGYHPLRTVFQAVGIFDVLTIEQSEKSSFTSNLPSLPLENTVTKALRLIQEASVVPPLLVHLEKKIPVESGLGGGSSDAAGLLRGIDAFLPVPLTQAFKHDVAVSVGADVAFFLVGGRARGEGYGELLTPMPDREPEWLLIVRPSFGCSTLEMFRELDATEYSWRDFGGDELYNDFERVAPCGCLEIIDQVLHAGATDAGLTGSGSAVFGRFESEDGARMASRRLASSYSFVEIAPTLSRADSLKIDVLE